MGKKSIQILNNIYMITLIIVTLLITISVHAVMFFNTDQNTDQILDNIIKNDAEISNVSIDSLPIINDISNSLHLKNTTYPVRYFYAVYNKQGNLIDININHIQNLTYSKAKSMLPKNINNLKSSNYFGVYKYKAYENNDQTVLVYLDCSINLYSIAISFFVSSLITIFIAISIIILLIINKRSNICSNIIINKDPSVFDENDSYPINIYSKSKELSKSKIKQHNKSELVISQKERMNLLIKKLLMLSNLKRKNWLQPFNQFNLSDTLLETILSFQTLEEVKQKHIELNIERGVIYNGNQIYIKELITVLMDNAIKYSEPFGTIIISLSILNDNINLSIKNTCDKLPSGNLSKLFQPFYRASCNNSRNGCNFGIGLAIAKSIVEAHSGNIYVYCEDNMIYFIVSLKSNGSD